MRYLTIILTFITCAISSYAENPRKWTETISKRQIDARIVDKKLDDSEVKLVISNGKAIWLKTDSFIKEDQTYILNWVKPVTHISARVIASGKGWKTVEVKANAGSRPLTVKVYWSEKGKRRKGYPKVHKLKKGEEKTFTHKVGSHYVVKGFVGKELVDKESWKSKTGL